MIYLKQFENYSRLITEIGWDEYYSFYINHSLQEFNKLDYKITKKEIESAYNKLNFPYRHNIGSPPDDKNELGTPDPIFQMEDLHSDYREKINMEFPHKENPIVVLSYSGKYFDIEIEKYTDEWYILHIHSKRYTIHKCDSIDSIRLISDYIVNKTNI